MSALLSFDGGARPLEAVVLGHWDRGEVTLVDANPVTIRDYAALAFLQNPNADRVLYLCLEHAVPLFLLRIGGRYHDVAGRPVIIKKKESE